MCISFQVEKSHKIPYVTKHVRSASLFALLYLDLCTFPKHSYNNEKYFLSIMDDHSKYMWLFPLNTKDPTSSTFLYFKTMVKKQFSQPILAIQKVGRVEFKPLMSTLEKKGVMHGCTCSYILEQNGAMEPRH